MAQVRMDKVQERAGDWGVVGAWGGWEETAPARVPAEIACARVAGPGFPTRQAFLATT